VDRAFADALVEAGERRDDIIAITAAMLRPTGCSRSRSVPDRVYDVGIAEQHAVASAAGSPSAACTPSSRSTPRS
jgi:1-deoxy-D-xylulose-5-phosphate synthase